MKYIGIDIGGTWIKGTIVDDNLFLNGRLLNHNDLQIKKIKSPLHATSTLDDFIEALNKLIRSFNVAAEEIAGIGISTGGIIDYKGSKVLKAASHLNVLKSGSWKSDLEKKLQCSVTIINDADAATIGLSETGSLTGNNTIGIMPIGTGLGFTVWRNGRRWRPGKALTLLGSIRLPDGNFDSFASASKLAELDDDNNLMEVLINPEFKEQLERYILSLVKVINSAAILYSLDEVVICGGLADAATECNYPLEKVLNDLLANIPVELEKSVKATVSPEGNRLQLIGALALARGESVATENRVTHAYNTLETEIPYHKDLQLHKMQTSEIMETFWQAEQESASLLKTSLSVMADIVDKSVSRIEEGGRIIYVGCGTSGRIAAMDAVEIPCTYGFPEDRILAVIAGGISDAAIEIESDFEEDASAVPEMLLINIKPEDIVIGISASGAAYYVQSALAFAKDRGALSVLIQTKLPKKQLPFCNHIIPLNSGNEVVAGSTRMKAGTATKKVLNFLSSTIMIKLGKVAGSYMIDVACINNKLVERAQSILKILYGIEKEDALNRLKDANMNLDKVIKDI